MANKPPILLFILILLVTGHGLLCAQDENGDDKAATGTMAAFSDTEAGDDQQDNGTATAQGTDTAASTAGAAGDPNEAASGTEPQSAEEAAVGEGYEPPGEVQEPEILPEAKPEPPTKTTGGKKQELVKPAEPKREVKPETPKEPDAPPQEPAAPAPKEEPAAPAKNGSAKTKDEAPPIEAGSITVNFKGADIRTVLAYIAEVSGVDIVPAPDVKGIVDLKLTNKPWKVAMDIILRNYGYSYEREGDIIRVVTIDKLKQEEPVSHSFSLNYSKAKDVSEAVKNIMSANGKVTSDERTNTIVVTDIPTNIYRIKQVIERLDKKTQQVLIEARIIETVLDNTEKLGIDWSTKFGITGARRPITFPFDNMKAPWGKKQDLKEYFPVVNSGNQATVAVSSATSTTTQTTNTQDFPAAGDAYPIFPFPFAQTSDFQFGTLDFTEFSAVVELLKQRANTDIVSNPRIATLNNSQAVISVGQTLNMPTYERNSSTGKMEITGYTAKDLGVELKVTPHINDNNEIVVDLTPLVSDLLRYDTLDRASGVVAPVFSQRIAKTQVMIKDGDTIFIGGLIKENEVEVKKKLPIVGDMLGDLPLVGLLFTKKEMTKQKTELIFFITVNLVSAGKEAKGTPSAAKVYAPQYTALPPYDVNIKKKLDSRMDD